MKEFSCRTQILAGTGAIAALQKRNIRRLFLVTDPYFAENGTAEAVARSTKAEAVEIFRDVMPDPTVTLAAKGTAQLKAFNPDTVLALGGGSAMDCAKAMLYFSGLDAKLVAIPTTSGSGSEVTDFAILTHENVKHPLVDSRLQPDVAVLDDELLKNMPASLIADSGFDVIAHSLEAYVGKNASAITDALARDAFCAVFGMLPASFAGHQQVRLQIHTAATMAGMAFSQAGLGLCHAMAHALGGMYHIPHGRLNAILLPAVVGCNARFAGQKYANLARSAGFGGSAEAMAVRNLKNGLIRLRKELKLPQTLAEAGIDPRRVRQDAQAIVTAVLKDPCCETNPAAVEDFMVRQVLEEVTGRG